MAKKDKSKPELAARAAEKLARALEKLKPMQDAMTEGWSCDANKHDKALIATWAALAEYRKIVRRKKRKKVRI